jgi:AcrR family transcriptional regulator
LVDFAWEAGERSAGGDQMPPKAPHAGDGDARRRGSSPRGELEWIHELQQSRRDDLRGAIMAATLLACGELGYGKVTVEAVLERYGGYRAQFYRHFANLGDCYAAAYEAEAGRLCDELLRVGAAQPSWRQGLRAALAELATFIRERPQAARALLVDVHIAGEPAMSMRNEMFERFSRAIDSARRETGSRHSPPPSTAQFAVSAIDAAVVSALLSGKPERFGDAAADLAQIVFTAYFGDDPGDDAPG